MIIYQADATEKSKNDYINGVDMQWWNIIDATSLREAKKSAKEYIAKNPEVAGVRVDRNCLTEGKEGIETVWYDFPGEESICR